MRPGLWHFFGEFMQIISAKNAVRFAIVMMIGTFVIFESACNKPSTEPPARSSGSTAKLPMPTSRTGNALTAPNSSAATTTGFEEALDKRYGGRPAEKEAMRNTVAELDARLDAEDRLAELDRRTMVIAARDDFRPENVARKIRLKLLIEKNKIKVGENLRFRLELTNIGREPLDYQENEPSIFKWGSLLDSMRTIAFILKDARNQRLELVPSARHGRTEALEYDREPIKSENEVRDGAARGAAGSRFKVKLLPGETLRSLGDGDTAQEPFRTLLAEEGYEVPGVYRIQVTLDDRPRPLSKGYIKAALGSGSTLKEIQDLHDRLMKKALGPVSSNIETFEVTR